MEEIRNQINNASTEAELRGLRISLEDLISTIDNRLKEIELEELYNDDDDEPWWNK